MYNFSRKNRKVRLYWNEIKIWFYPTQKDWYLLSNNNNNDEKSYHISKDYLLDHINKNDLIYKLEKQREKKVKKKETFKFTWI